MSDSILWCPVQNYKNYLFLDTITWKVVSWLNKRCGLQLVICADIERDSAAILSNYMSRRREKSLERMAPHLVQEWHTERNGFLTPAVISFGSGKRVWWRCEKGHEWQERVSNRSHLGYGCPYCFGKRPTQERNFSVLYFSLMLEWHPTKNGILTPRDVAPHSSKAVWWQCERGHEWRRKIAYEINSQGCPYCSGRLACKDNSLVALHSDLAREWDVTKNDFLSPHDVTVKTRKRVWWRCDRGHSWQMNISVRCSGIGGCPCCVGKRVCEENSLQTLSPQIAAEWDKEKTKILVLSWSPIMPASRFGGNAATAFQAGNL